MRVVITTIVSLNPGDAAILEGTLALLREAFGEDVEVTVMDKDGLTADGLYPWAQFHTALFSRVRWGRLRRRIDNGGDRVMWLDSLRLRLAGRLLRGPMAPLSRMLVTADERRTLEAYLSADLVIASGGTYLVEHYNLLSPILEYEVVLGLGRPLVFFPQSMGPFRNTAYRDRLRSIFLRAWMIFLRDRRSEEHLTELGVPREKLLVAGDAAFALASCKDAEEGPPTMARDPRIAVSVREWSEFGERSPKEGRRQYLDSVAAAVTAITRQRKARVTFLSTCQGIPQYWADDARIADEVVARLPDDVAATVEVDRRFRQPRDMVRAYGDFDGVVATRMHAAILAMCAGVPTLGIAYEFKTTELFRVLGLEEWSVEIGRLRPDVFARHAIRFVDGLAKLRALFREGAAMQRERLEAMVPDLREVLKTDDHARSYGGGPCDPGRAQG